MLNEMKIKDFGPLMDVRWKGLSRINLVIGINGSGKTFLLKALYSAMRTLEEYKRGDDRRTASEILATKLYWTFQPDRIGDLVSKGKDSLSFSIHFEGREFCYSFGKDTTKQISTLENHVEPRESNSIFLPAKEVLSLHNIILKSREEDRSFGFDDTYFDLAKALQQPLARGRNYPEFSQFRKSLEEIVEGKVRYDEASKRWQFWKGNQKFPIGVTAEGVKKIAILDTLLGNRYLDTNSLIFVDEPESALHPTAISKLVDIISVLAERNIQFFLATHSYFVVKKLFLIAQEKDMSISVASSHPEGKWKYADLKDGMPDNAIVNEAIRLYDEEVELALA